MLIDSDLNNVINKVKSKALFIYNNVLFYILNF